MKKTVVFLLGFFLFCMIVGCVLSLYRNVLSYLADYYSLPMLAIRQHLIILISLCVCGFGLGKYGIERLHQINGLKVACLTAMLGLMLSALGTSVSILVGGGLVLSGLMMSMSGFIHGLMVLADVYKGVLWLCIVSLAWLLIDLNLLRHVQSFYSFREWCLALTMLLALMALTSRFMRFSQCQIA